MKFCIRYAALTAALALVSFGAQASNYVLNLSGTLASAGTNGFDSGGTHYDQWFLSLNGLDSSNAITLSQGDSVSAVITFDGPLTVPASVDRTSFVFVLAGPGFPSDPIQTSGTASLSLLGTSVASSATNCGTSTQIASCWGTIPPDNGSVSFDQVTLNFSVDTLSTPGTANASVFAYTLFSPSAPVPEPISSVLLLAGLGALVLRRRQSELTLCD